MKTRIGSVVLLCMAFTLGCSQTPAPKDLLAELTQRQQKDRIGIGWVYQQHELNVIVFSAKPEMRKYSLPSGQGQTVTASRQDRTQISGGTDALRSPDGKWMTYRTRDNKFVLADANGKTDRTLLKGNRVLTPLYWSPDSQYLMYVQKGGTWDVAGLRCGDDTFNVIVYRLRDGKSGSVYQSCQGYPYGGFQWLQIPSNLPL